jgi:hypothetical protein
VESPEQPTAVIIAASDRAAPRPADRMARDTRCNEDPAARCDKTPHPKLDS